MNRRRFFALATGMLMLPSIARANPPMFEVGQVWTLKPPLEGSARVRVGRIEDGGATIHISLWGLEAPAPEGTAVLQSPLFIGHLPVAADALAESVQALSNDLPPENLRFEEGYATWREANGGVFTIPVAGIVEAILQTVRTGQAK